MKHTLAFSFTIFILLSSTLKAQPCTFSQRHTTQHTNSVFSSISVVNEHYYTAGVVADTVPFGYIGSEVNVFTKNGELLNTITAKAEGVFIEAWGVSSAIIDERYLFFAGSISGDGKELLIGKYGLEDNTLQINNIPHPNYPTSTWFRASGIKAFNESLYVYGNMEKSSGIGENEGFLWGLDEDLEWSSGRIVRFPSPSTTAIEDVILLNNGNILILAREFQTGQDCEPYLRFHLIEYDANLSHEVQRYTHPTTENWNVSKGSLLQSENGAVYLHGEVVGYRNTMAGGSDCVISILTGDPRVIKFNRQLERVWIKDLTREFDQNRTTEANSLTPIYQTAEGDFITAYGGVSPGDTTAPRFQSLIHLITFDSSGTLLNREMHSGFTGDTIGVKNYVYDMQPTPDGGYVLVGQSQRHGRSPEGDTTQDYRQRGWILKVDGQGRLLPACDTIVDATDFSQQSRPDILLFPNPVDDILNLVLPDSWSGPTGLTVTDVRGRTVLKQQLPGLNTGDSLQFSVRNVKTGIYFLTVTNGRYRWQRRFIKR
jgi:hypothetical protein